MPQKIQQGKRAPSGVCAKATKVPVQQKKVVCTRHAATDDLHVPVRLQEGVGISKGMRTVRQIGSHSLCKAVRFSEATNAKSARWHGLQAPAPSASHSTVFGSVAANPTRLLQRHTWQSPSSRLLHAFIMRLTFLGSGWNAPLTSGSTSRPTSSRPMLARGPSQQGK